MTGATDTRERQPAPNRASLAQPAAATSASIADVALQEREAAFEKKRRPPQPPMRLRLLRFWISPRGAMRDVLTNDPRRLVLLVAALMGASVASFGAEVDEASPQALLTLCTIFLGAIVGSIARLYVRALITGGVCRFLGGDITNIETCAVLTWSSLPVALVSLVALPRMFALIATRMDSPPGLFAALRANAVDVAHLYDGHAAALGFFSLAAVVYALVLEVVLLADAAGIKMWHALIATSVSTILPIALMVAVASGL